MAWAPVVGGIAAGLLGGGKGGGGGDKAANTQSRLAQQLFQQTDPLRRSLIARSQAFLGAPAGAPATGGVVDGIVGRFYGEQPQVPQVPVGPGDMGGGVMNTPTYLAFKDAADSNFARAKDNAIARLPAGGALLESLVGLEGDRASTLTQGAGQIYSDELARALSLATGTAPTALNSMGQAAAIQAASASAAADRNAQKAGSIGEGLGTYLGSK